MGGNVPIKRIIGRFAHCATLSLAQVLEASFLFFPTSSDINSVDFLFISNRFLRLPSQCTRVVSCSSRAYYRMD